MVGSIVPVVNGQFARYLLWGTIPIYLLASVISAAVLGLTLGTFGTLLNRFGNSFAWIPAFQNSLVWGFLALLCLGYALHELRLIKMPRPQIKRQVPRRWIYQFHPFLTWLLFGLGLGIGVATFIPFGTFYIVLLMALLSKSPLYAMVLMAIFGFGRAMMTLILAAPFWASKGEPRVWGAKKGVMSWVNNYQECVHFINGMVLAMVGALLFGTLI